MKKLIAFWSVILCAAGSQAAQGPAGDGILSCSTNDYKTNVQIDAIAGKGEALVEGPLALQIKGASAYAVVAQTPDSKNLIAVVTQGGELIQISATGFYTAYCSGCQDGQSLNYKKATLSRTHKGVLSILSGLTCRLELPVE